MHALIVGIPLSHVIFDNYPVLPARSLSDHWRAVAEMSALSDAVEEFEVRLAPQRNQPEEPPQCIRKEAS
jgi:hypothetical protein